MVEIKILCPHCKSTEYGVTEKGQKYMKHKWDCPILGNQTSTGSN